MSATYDDEKLMAFADGRLEEPLFSEIADAVEADPEIAARVEQLALGARLVKELYGPLIDQPIPDELLRRVENLSAAKPTARIARRPAMPLWTLAAAACVGILVATPLAYLYGASNLSAIVVGAPLGQAIAEALDTLPSGTERRAGNVLVRPIATFSNSENHVCREFEADGVSATVAVACRTSQGWEVDFTISAPLGAGGYAPASSLEALDVYLVSIAATPPMSLEDEAATLGF
jgi:hypothetical protein